MSNQSFRDHLLAHLEEREERAEFLANASKLMIRTSKVVSGELGEDETLAALASLALPHQGAWSILDVLVGDTTRRIPVIHPVPRQQALARALSTAWPPPRHGSDGARVFRSHRSEIIANVTDAMLCEVAESPHHLEVLRELRIGSVLTVALVSDGEAVGTMTFIAPRWGHSFDERDRLLAEDVAAGAALAISTSRRSARHAEHRATALIAEVDRAAFMASLGHTFRTPLHNINGYAQLLDAGVRGPLNGEQRHHVHRIQANERHLLNLVGAIVSYARWDESEPPPLEDLSVSECVRLTNVAVAGAAASKGVVYRPATHAIPDDLMVRAEPLRLREILLQLLMNAVKFSRARDTISVSARKVGARVAIRIADTGIGIAEAEHDVIFRPFVRVRDAYVWGQPGVGLGLAITQKLARAMGGEVSVTSAPGGGSTFTLALPGGRAHRDVATTTADLSKQGGNVGPQEDRRDGARRSVDRPGPPSYEDQSQARLAGAKADTAERVDAGRTDAERADDDGMPPSQ